MVGRRRAEGCTVRPVRLAAPGCREQQRERRRDVSSADLAIIAMAVVSLASIGRDYKLHMKVADRLRVVSPPKQQAQPAADATVEDLAKRRTG